MAMTNATFRGNRTKTLRLFVFKNFCPSLVGPGLAFAIAEDEHEAKELIVTEQELEPWEWGDMEIHPINGKVARALVIT